MSLMKYLLYYLLLFVLFSSVFSPFLASADTTAILYPIADGTNDSANWNVKATSTSCNTADCYVEIDESSGGSCSNTSDGDTTHIRSTNTMDSQTFDIDASGIPNNATITNIAVTMCSRRNQNGALLQARHCFNGSCVNSGADISQTASYTQYTQNFPVNYIKTALSDLEIGLQSTSDKTSRVSAVSAVITYATDTTPPTISSIGVDSITTATARVYWTTNEISTSQIEYGPSMDYGFLTPLDPILNKDHSMVLTDLSENTLYHLKVRSVDESGNEVISSDVHFSTVSSSAVISGISPHEITSTSLHISWVTNEPTDSQIEYGTTTSYGLMTTLDTSLITEHEQFITNLSAGTTHHLRIYARDSDGNLAISNNYVFTTLPGIAVRQISQEDYLKKHAHMSEVKASQITENSAVISWTTSASGTTQVEYGLTGSYGSSTKEDKELVDNHSVKLNYLIPNTEYHFRAVSIDVARTLGYSIDTTFKTLPGKPDTVSPEAIKDLKAEVLSQTSVKLSWTAPADLTGVTSYDINSLDETIAENNFYTAKVVHETEITLDDIDRQGVEHSYEVVGLKSGETKYFAIKSADPYKNISPISNVIYVKILPSGELADITAPAKVSNVKAAGLDKLIFLQWDNPKDQDFVRTRIMKSETVYPDSPYAGILVYDGNSSRFSDINLVNGKTYYYAIFAYDQVPNYSEPVFLALAPYAERTHYHILKEDTENTLVITKDLKLGDEGEEVQHLQEHLSNEPLIYPEGLITGYFGKLTELAIKRLQKTNNLDETGIVDAALREIIEKISFPNEIIETTEEGLLKSFAHDMYVGLQGEDVKTLQAYLKKEGFFNYEIITGYFGQITKQAVIDFQKKNNIEPAVGYVGPITRAKILESSP